ncbi:MAG: hypothetical protein ABH800_01880 [Candidatus Nealsonbacteria bacterium]
MLNRGFFKKCLFKNIFTIQIYTYATIGSFINDLFSLSQFYYDVLTQTFYEALLAYYDFYFYDFS